MTRNTHWRLWREQWQCMLYCDLMRMCTFLCPPLVVYVYVFVAQRP
jgi:hypothetical protein